jgi:hypothetical protein
LLDYESADEWRGSHSPGSSAESPVWLVGIEGTNLSRLDVMASVLTDDTVSDATIQVDGAYYLWDANAGVLAGFGVLDANASRSFDSIQALQSLSIDISPATPDSG